MVINDIQIVVGTLISNPTNLLEQRESCRATSVPTENLRGERERGWDAEKIKISYEKKGRIAWHAERRNALLVRFDDLRYLLVIFLYRVVRCGD